ncbi:BTAD domain-containing putative transcriptional regulator [Actinoplanes flavus]|uniref:Winged helix-turn-helix domain-containing protein n=1 Tax=Actinoplanes flavus TaxID=2820290 RepID=A0ABS3UI45_9ACTN|nr:BTAD domain-containing putative transcriptional regulator [Actinoplanes flavus]MBO3738449.1 winged helix-turn-helix domain-containing protein [Actinoplanes flavus]
MEIGVLGPVRVESGDGRPFSIPGARLRTLVVLLALDAGRTVSAERLIDGVWGAAPPAATANALQALVSRLRRAVPDLVIETAPNGYRLALEPDRVDAHRFARLVAEDPAKALGLWRGDPEFPEVAEAEAIRLRSLWLTARKAWLAGEMADRDVVAELAALAAEHPLDETLAALLIRALRRSGDRARALEVFAGVRQRLADDLGVDPSEELAALHLDLLRETGRRGNLPAEVSSFVGRDDDVRAVRGLTGAHRLVTLTGPGGSGKTRLAVEVGARLPGPVWLAELAPVRDPAELPRAVLTALDLRSPVLIGREQAPPLDRLREAVATREMLLILDNCEHLIAAAAELADTLLRAAPGLRIVATSREPLGIPGERLFPVEPLGLPPADAGPEAAGRAPAVRLLLDRAPALTLTPDDTPAVVRVCRALDGIPLAIELAAARSRTLPVDVLADRLTDRFRLLTGGSRTALPRHRTLRAVVDWSWDPLSEEERRTWRRLALLPGGADVTAVERVCGPDLDPLAALVDKSLLVLGTDGRYRMLETIREYGLERLDESGDGEDARRAIAAHLLALAREAEPRLRRADQLTWMRRLTEERDNLHASVRAAITAADRATAVSLCAALGFYWWLGGNRMEGATLCAGALALPGTADRAELALVHAFSALNGIEGAMEFTEVRAAFRNAEEAAAGVEGTHPLLRLIRPLVTLSSAERGGDSFGGARALLDDPDPWLRAVAVMFIAQIRLNFGEEPATAEAELRQALAGFRAIGERWGTGFTLTAMADLAAARGDREQAIACQREALALIEEVGLREELPQFRVKLAHQLWLAGDLDGARETLDRAEEHAREDGGAAVTAAVNHGRATIALAEGRIGEARELAATTLRVIGRSTVAPQFQALAHTTAALAEGAGGDLDRAAALHGEALRISTAVMDGPVVAAALAGAADHAARSGDPARAATLLGAADAVRGSRDRSDPHAGRVEREARAALGDAGFEQAYERGDGVTMRTALETFTVLSGRRDLVPSGLAPHRRDGPKEGDDVTRTGKGVSDAAAEGPDGERGEDQQESRGPGQ